MTTSAIYDPNPKVVWKPQAGSQVAYLTCPLFEVLYGGTRGPGKTDAMLMDFAQHIGRGYGAEWRGIIFRRTFPELADIIVKTKKWFPQIWPNAKYNHTNHQWEWPTGETLLFRPFTRDEDYWSFHGQAFTFIGWEELCTWPTLGGYKRMMSCCRSTFEGIPLKYRATANPYGPGHNVVKHRFRLSGIPRVGASPVIRDSFDEEGNPEVPRVYIHGDLDENQILLRADPGYKDRLKLSARNPSELKAWLHGSWDVVSGGMFDDVWDQSIHILEPFQVPESWPITRSFDWGSSKPFSVGWWARSNGEDYVDHNNQFRATVRGDLFRIMEWYGWNGQPNEGTRMLATEVARGIIEREIEAGIYRRSRQGPADSAIFNVDNGRSVADDMAQPLQLDDGRRFPGVFWLRADKSAGSRKIGWEQVRTRLSNAKPRPGIGREKAGLFVFRNCQQFLRTFPTLSRSLRDPDDVNTETEDHIADEVRYRVRYESQQVGQTTTQGPR